MTFEAVFASSEVMADNLVVPWRCSECGCEVGGPVEQPHWYRADVEGDPPQLVVFCERCAERELGMREL